MAVVTCQNEKKRPVLKFCGIKHRHEVLWLNAHGLEGLTHVGFVLAKSKRQIELSKLAQLTTLLHERFIPVGVFVNPTEALLLEGLDAGLKVIQLHGDESIAFVANFKTQLEKLYRGQNSCQIWKAVRIGDNLIEGAAEIQKWLDSGLVSYVVLDAWHKHAYGGTGHTFDWNFVKLLSHSDKLIIAGGVNVQNLESLFKVVMPGGVDLSSSIEGESGKDPDKMHAFLEHYNYGGRNGL